MSSPRGNLHASNHGISLLTSLYSKDDVIFVQEHWLVLFDLHRLYNLCYDYICFARAVDEVIFLSCLRGHPFGGVTIFVKKSLGNSSILVKASSRCIIVKIGDVLFANVY